MQAKGAMMKKLYLLTFLLMLAHAHAGELYRSIDSSGQVHYSDTPLPDAEAVEKLKSDILPNPDEGLPYETQRAKQNFPVTLYVFKDCGSACKQARDFLDKRGIPFSENNLAKQEDIDAFQKASGDGDVPKLLIGKTWLKGFLAEPWNRELDFAGYPKTSTYRPRPAASAPSASPNPETPPAQPEQ
jgi:glutaredoxin